MSSIPMLSRMKSGLTPAVTICSSVSWLWVVVAGWIARLLASPTFARWLKSSRPSMNFWPAPAPPLMPDPRTSRGALRQISSSPARDGVAGQAGIAHPGDPRMVGQERRTVSH